MNNTEMINHWILHQKRERGRSTQTLYSYSQDSKRLLTHLGDRSLVTVGVEELRGWVHAPLVKGAKAGLAPSASTLKRRVSMLRAMFRFLHAEGLLPANPAERLVAPTVHNEAPKPCDWDDWRRLWNSNLSDTDRVGFGLGLFCGLRRIEVVDMEKRHLRGERLIGFRRKGGRLGNVPWLSCVRFFAHADPSLVGGTIESFTDPLNRVLRARKADETLVSWQDEAKRTCPPKYSSASVDPQHMNRHLERALRDCGMKTDAFTPHQLRHGFCTFLLANGVPLLEVSRLAGHSNVTITQRYIETADDPLAALMGDSGSEQVEGVLTFGRI